jgi:hypothetical protein
VAAIVALLLSGGAFLTRFIRSEVVAAPAPEPGTLVVMSKPAGLQVLVDGVDQGRTPARLSIQPGGHTLEVHGRGGPRTVPVTVAAGGELTQHFEFAVPDTGDLRVESQAAGAMVLVDGVERGVAPLTVSDLPSGDHAVVVQTKAGSSRHVVRIQPGATATLKALIVAAPTPTAPSWGWLAVKVPFPVEIRVGGRPVGTNDVDRIKLPAGRHEIQLVNDAIGYRTGRVVRVQPGKTATLAVELPRGSVSINALPWAEVWLGKQRLGETPLANVSVPVGRHEVVFRHPQLGEKRQTISVTFGTPVRVSVDMK